MAGAPKKYYWLKLQKDFFKRHDIRIIESMPNGKDYIIFYLKLLTESISHDGQLRFSEVIPYESQMLSVITNTNPDIVKAAIDIFKSLNLMEVWDDKTIYMTETTKMLGTETEWAIKKREYRNLIGQSKDNVRTKKDNVRQEKELEIDIELDKEIDIKKESIKEKAKSNRFVKPTVDEIKEYVKEKYDVDGELFSEKFFNFYESKGWMVGRSPMKDWKAAVRNWAVTDNMGKSNIDKLHEQAKNRLAKGTENLTEKDFEEMDKEWEEFLRKGK